MRMFLNAEVLARAQELLDRNEGAPGVYEFSLHETNVGPRVVIASDPDALLPLNSVTYAGKVFYIGFPLEQE